MLSGSALLGDWRALLCQVNTETCPHAYLSWEREAAREERNRGKKSEEVAEGREKEEGRLKSREKGSVSMATTVVHPPTPTSFPTPLQRTLVVFV